MTAATADESAASRLHSFAIHLLRWARSVDERTGLSAARLSALSVLVFGGERTVTELAAAEQVAVPTMTRLLQALETDGYVQRRRDRSDNRIVCVRATAKGRRALEAGRRARVAKVQEIMNRLDAAQRAEVVRTLSLLESTLRASIAADR